MSRSPAALLLESYVLDAIGALSEDRARLAQKLVLRLFDRPGGDWRDILREEFGLAPTIRDQLRDMWLGASQVAQGQGVELRAEQFAAMVVEENFSDAVEMVSSEIVSGWED